MSVRRCPNPASIRVTRGCEAAASAGLIDVNAGSWAALTEAGGAWTVRQGGSNRIWDAIEHHVNRWREHGAPELDQFTVTATLNGHTITCPGN